MWEVRRYCEVVVGASKNSKLTRAQSSSVMDSGRDASALFAAAYKGTGTNTGTGTGS